MSQSVLFVINKFSGSGFKPELEGRIIDKCRQAGIETRIEFTQKRGHATALARWAVDQKMDYVFAVGGDGTVNEVAQGLVHTPVALGILPKGSGNGLARHLQIPMGIQSLNLVDNHRVEWIDTVYVNKRMSVNVSGFGFDAHIASLFAGRARRGLVGYTRLVVKEFSSFPSFDVQVDTEEASFRTRCFIVAIANASQFGNNARVAPLASVKDQLIDISFIQKITLLRAPAFAQKMFTGNLDKSPFVKMNKSKSVNFELAEPLPFHVDGEPLPPIRHINCTINSRSLKILLPGDNREAEKNKYHI